MKYLNLCIVTAGLLLLAVTVRGQGVNPYIELSSEKTYNMILN